MPENRIETQGTVSTLVGGIISDAQQLIRQEFLLARKEVQQEVEMAKTAALSLVVGAGITAVAGVLLSFTLVYLLHWLTNPADPSNRFPLWACYGIIGGLFAVVGAGLLYLARQKASEIHVVPPRTAETLKENVEWIQNQT
jgi:hypothetical protein